MRLDRLNDMEQYVLEQGTSSLEELCQHFNVSMNTVRRDLADLVQRGRLKKVYGGVSAGTPSRACAAPCLSLPGPAGTSRAPAG